MDAPQVLEILKAKGYRLTGIRRFIVEAFVNSPSPISAVDIVQKFRDQSISANKTTVYREIESLLGAGLLREVSFRDGTKRYEIDSTSHHHHLICLKCGEIADVELETDLEKEEQKIKEKFGFTVDSHSLEFFGICQKCQNNTSADI